jgi:hypothetical protein
MQLLLQAMMAIALCHQALAIPAVFLQEMPPAPVGAAVDDSEESDDNAVGMSMAEPNFEVKMPKAAAPTSLASMNAPKRPEVDSAIHLVANAESQQPKAAVSAPGMPDDNARRTVEGNTQFMKYQADTSSPANKKAMEGGGEYGAPTADAPQFSSAIASASVAGKTELAAAVPGAAPAEAVKMYNPELFKVHVRVPNWDDLQIYAEKGYSSRTVKSIIEAKWGIRNTKLWFQRKEIPDDTKLGDVGVKADSIINVVVRCSKDAVRSSAAAFQEIH